MATDEQWYWLARDRCRSLAVQLVRMDALAEAFEAQADFLKADTVRFEREVVRHERSLLLREMWAVRGVVARR